MNETVVLIHGLWMPRHVCGYLARALRRAGFAPRLFGYPSMHASLDENAAALASYVVALDGVPFALVAHSLGGLVALRMLERARPAGLSRIVLLGSPVNGSAAARWLTAQRWSRPLAGHSIPAFTAPGSVSAPAGIAAGVIAGTLRIGLGALLVRNLPLPNDGVVAVEETRLAGAADHITLPVSHSGMLLSPEVARQSAYFLAHGRFAPGESAQGHARTGA